MDRFRSLDDVQLAILLSLVARNHCLITTDEEHLDRLQQELERIGSSGFGLSTAVVKCTNTTTLDEFTSAIFVQDVRRPIPSPVVSSDSRDSGSYLNRRHVQRLGIPSQGASSDDFVRGRRIANFIIARDLDLASNRVQTQALDLIRNKCITAKTIYHAPSPFLLIALIPKTASKPKLNVHLSDHFFISHYHDPQDELDHESITNDGESTSSSVVIRKIGPDNKKPQNLLFSAEELKNLSHLADGAYVSVEITRYIMDIIVFLRMHRAVAGGISAKATRDFELLVKCLCPLNGLEFATPSLVELAVYKIYTHRIVVADKRTDRSIMWGSKPEAVEKYLAQVDANMIIDNVLEDVKAPL